MKKIFKNPIFTFIIGVIITGSISVFATIAASNITYKNTNVEEALDDLYEKANSNDNDAFCILLSGTKNTVGAKYACNPGDGIIRNFYLLAIDNNKAKLIMEQNLSDTVGSPRMNYATALAFFETGAGVSTKNAWTNVDDVDLPSAQDIANAGGITGWDVTTATRNDKSYFGANGYTDSDKGNRTPYVWLYNYTRGCSYYGACTNEYGDNDTSKSYGYWTKDMVYGSTDRAWGVIRTGALEPDGTSSQDDGVRPVITVLKSNLAG